MENNVKELSWAFVFIALITFYPLGVLLLVWRISADRTAVYKSYDSIKLMASGMIMWSILVFAAAKPETRTMASIKGMVLLCTAVWIFFSLRQSKLNGLYYRYIRLIAIEKVLDIDEIATTMGLTFDDVVKDLTKIIEAKCLIKLRLDVYGRQLVREGTWPEELLEKGAKQAATAEPAADKAEEPATHSVSCKNCGALNTVLEGQAAECEYCGSPLQAPRAAKAKAPKTESAQAPKNERVQRTRKVFESPDGRTRVVQSTSYTESYSHKQTETHNSTK